MTDIYPAILATGAPHIGVKGSLYCKITLETQKIVDNYPHKGSVTTFNSKIDGTPWYDLPYAFTPIWEKKHKMPVGLQRRV